MGTLPEDCPRDDMTLQEENVGKPAVALIVAGSGEVNDKEVFDLLDDAYPEDDYSEIGVIVGLGKALFTPAVQYAIEWLNYDKSVYGVIAGGEKPTRTAKAYAEDAMEVKEFADIFDPEEFKDWDEVHFLVALPDDPESPEYEDAAAWIEKAVGAEVKVFNLSRGLDDIVLEDPDAAPPEEEPEEPAEAPKRKSRARKAAEEPAEPEEPDAAASEAVADPWKDDGDSQNDIIYDALTEIILGLAHLQEAFRPTTRVEPKESLDPHVEVQAEKPTAKDGTKRGRPRSNFEVSQVFDEDDEEWIPRPKGRLTKGTRWRKIHSETDEVLEEGTA